MRKVAVTGGRNFNDWRLVWQVLSIANETDPVGLLVHGACPTGADRWAMRLADFYQVPHTGQTYAANWTLSGRAAGPIRNHFMLKSEMPDELFSFPGGSGTKDCTTKAIRMGINVTYGIKRL